MDESPTLPVVLCVSLLLSPPLPRSWLSPSLADRPVALLAVPPFACPSLTPSPPAFPLTQVSKISLVDLAGSERADSSGARGMRLKVRGLGGTDGAVLGGVRGGL